MRKFFLILLVFFSNSIFASQTAPLPLSACKAQAPFGIPTSTAIHGQLICRHAYLTAIDLDRKIPVWVSYVLTPDHAIGCAKRKNSFAADLSVDVKYQATPKDYLRSGYDMGHLANNADMSWDTDIEEESFLLTNIAPQLPKFNRGVWKKLEALTRTFVINRTHSIQIITGVGPSSATFIGNGVDVPLSFWKVLIDLSTKEVIAFNFTQADPANLSQAIVDVKHLPVIIPLPRGNQASTKMWDAGDISLIKEKKLVCGINR
jgi:endonuclease G